VGIVKPENRPDFVVKKNEFLEKISEEKVEYEIRDTIRAYPRDYERIVKSLNDWSSQFD
jgi:hypothetical protein